MSQATLLIVTADRRRGSQTDGGPPAARHWAADQLPRLLQTDAHPSVNEADRSAQDQRLPDSGARSGPPIPPWAIALAEFGYTVTTVGAADLGATLKQQSPDVVLIELTAADGTAKDRRSGQRYRFNSFESGDPMAGSGIGPDPIGPDGHSAAGSAGGAVAGELETDLDGIELGGALRHRYGLPVVYVLAEAAAALIAQAEITGPYGYLVAPFAPPAMHLTLTTALGRYRADRQMQATLRKYQEQAALKSRFVAVASHEFRNPLNAILFSSELLQRYGGEVSNTKRDTYFDRIHTSVKRISHLLDNVLTIGESDAGQLNFTPQALGIVAFCQELIEELEPAGTSKIEFTAPGISGDLQLELDEKLLRHILSNLLANAIKYSPQGQPIQFALTMKRPEQRPEQPQEQPQAISFGITDHGIGISEHDQAQLFTSFHRGSNARSIPGTGLGLSIVKQCVELHGGQIAVESVIDQGSRFTVCLPTRWSQAVSTTDLGSEICA